MLLYICTSMDIDINYESTVQEKLSELNINQPRAITTILTMLQNQMNCTPSNSLDLIKREESGALLGYGQKRECTVCRRMKASTSGLENAR